MIPADCAAIARRRVSKRPGCDFDELHQVAQIAAWRAPRESAGAAAKRAIIDHCRRETHSRRRYGIPYRALEWQERADADHTARLAVARALERSPERLREVIVLRFWYGFRLCEIAARFGVNESRAHQLVHDGLGKLREVLA